MQNRGGGAPPPVGIIYNTSMHRPDAALALGAFYAYETKREAKVGSVCVVGAGLNAAIFCDIVARLFIGNPQPGNQQLPAGLAIVDPMPPDSAMVQAVVAQSRYNRSIQRVSDTSQAEAVLRNGVIFNATSAMVLSAPATIFAKSLDLLGVVDLFKDRVKRLVIVDSGEPQRDIAALRKVIGEFPSPVFFCGKEVGQSLLFPAASIEKDFAWASAHPVADAYRAARPMPYDAPSHDLAAAHYAVHPELGFFQESAPGTLSVTDEGVMRFAVGGEGKIRSLTVDPAKRADLLQALIAIASARPPAPSRGRGNQQ